MRDAYITALGKFFPGYPIPNDEMEDYLGRIHGRPSRVRERVLRQNQITTRHFAIDRAQQTTHSNAKMAAEAFRDMLAKTSSAPERIGFLATATSQPDLPLPGFASMVHGELGIPTCEIASFHGVCSCGVMALKSAVQAVQSGEHEYASCCASEFASRLFKASRFEAQSAVVGEDGSLPFDTEFLRWMLSDGAGAALVRPTANERGLSLRVEWIRLRSLAHRYSPCMFVGEQKDGEQRVPKSWLDFESYQAAAAAGAINLRQDVRMLKDVIACAVDGALELYQSGLLRRGDPDWFLCHYSSHVFRGEADELMRRAGIAVPQERWFTNLYTRGNVGAASFLVMLEELFYSGKLSPGHRIFAVIPESGRFNFAYVLMTVVGSAEDAQARPETISEEIGHSAPPAIHTSGDPLGEDLVQRLARVWFDFESQLSAVPFVRRLHQGALAIEDYRALLFNLRQQVIDGSRWISRAASNVTADFFPIRSAFIGHSSDEHRDYEMLERDYVSVGGKLEDIRAGTKNIGSEALSEYILSRASRENPFDLIGAMFIIEGLGQRIAHRWGTLIRRQLNLREDQVSFLLYHSASDIKHFERLDLVVQSGLLTPELNATIERTARVVGRLYALQLEEIDYAVILSSPRNK